jgi:large subunit ribosomal protein L21
VCPAATRFHARNYSDWWLTESELGNAKVIATITANDRAKKVLVFKFKRKKQYKRTIGHRQHFTELKVNEIVA